MRNKKGIGTAFLFVIFLQTDFVQCFKFESTDDPLVTFGDFNEKTQRVSFDENNDRAVKLVKISDVTDLPEVGVIKGSESDFNWEFSSGGPPYVFTEKNLIDYEKKNCQEFTIKFSTSEDTYYLIVTINNINDNPPTIFCSHCKMLENNTITVDNTDCNCTVGDPDGSLTGITYELDQYDDLFELGFKEKPEESVTSAQVNLYLKDGQILDYETTTFYLFHLKANDQKFLSDEAQATVEVIDIPDEPPKWIKILFTHQVYENTEESLQIKAIDGDIQVNAVINYKIDANGCSCCDITIDKETGKILVKPIDREESGDSFVITVTAYERDDTTSKLSEDITFFILDEDDNLPNIIEVNETKVADDKAYSCEIPENSMGVLFGITADDLDIGDNAKYKISLEDIDDSQYAEAFKIAPVNGYQQTDFTITIADSSKLDYEDKTWRIIKFKVRTEEIQNATMTDSVDVTINLLNLNDEPPIFQGDLSAEVREDVVAGDTIGKVYATDRDEGDRVRYFIVGNWKNKFGMNEDTGEITAKINDSLDYEKQNVVSFEVQAKDNDDTHVVQATFTINVIDVDDEQPTISIGSTSFEVEENTAAGTEIECEIFGEDPDTQPNLIFYIDWDKSRVTKNSVQLDREIFEKKGKCIEVNQTQEDTIQRVQAKLWIKDDKEHCDLDFETYDTLYINLVINDNNTEKGEPNNTAVIAITVTNVNDNPPEFKKETLENLYLSDGATKGVSIGTIIATDPDIGDNITYSIRSEDAKKNPEWVDIGETTGILNVKDGITVDDDEPPRDTLEYTVIAFDGIHKTKETLTITLNDINDNSPVFEEKKMEVHILENRTDGVVSTITATDSDRDEDFHLCQYSFSTSDAEVTNRFEVDLETGNVSVSLAKGYILDRDEGQDHFVCDFQAIDNPNRRGGIQRSDKMQLTIYLDDVNNKAPYIETKQFDTISENAKENSTLSKLTGVDKDGPGDNSNIRFKIVKVEKDDKVSSNESLTEEDFDIDTEDNKTATVTLLKDMRNYWGNYILHIETRDYGNPEMETPDNEVALTIQKFNFEAPTFKFPDANPTDFYLSKTQTLNRQLKTYTEEYLQNFDVDDHQEGKWDVTYSLNYITAVDPEDQIFTIEQIGSTQGQMQITSDHIEKIVDTYSIVELEITASVKDKKETDEADISVKTRIKIHFIDNDTPPTFKTHEFKCDLLENDLEAFCIIPEASYPDDIVLPDLKVFYVVLKENIFTINENANLSLSEPLDYEQIKKYDLTVVSSNRKDKVPEKKCTDCYLSLTIDVTNVNDEIPVFSSEVYYGSIISKYVQVVIVEATDKDGPDDILTYAIDQSTFEPHGDNIDKIAADQFKIDKDGSITVNDFITSEMTGYFSFNVTATDSLDNIHHNASAYIEAYLITDTYLVQFRFGNPENFIKNNVEKLTAVLDDQLTKYTSHVALTEQETNNSTSDDDVTEVTKVQIYFIDNNHKPVLSEDVLKEVGSVKMFAALKTEFKDSYLNLLNFENKDKTKEDIEGVLKTWLIAVSVVLGTLVVILVIAFILKTRTLVRRINNLSTTKFGSQESGLNRLGLAAPTTNKHAIEGSNPVFTTDTEEKEIEDDRQSVTSGDSDLIGVEDNPEFDQYM